MMLKEDEIDGSELYRLKNQRFFTFHLSSIASRLVICIGISTRLFDLSI